MPTLDELIVQERKTAEHNHNMYEYECSFYGKEVVDSGEKLDCVKEYEYHSQIAELLEELKARREADRISDSYPFDVLLVQRYTKAIDDFAKELCKAFDETTLNDDGYYPNNVVRSIAEQLKAGGESE